jgi:hypothetical protein
VDGSCSLGGRGNILGVGSIVEIIPLKWSILVLSRNGHGLAFTPTKRQFRFAAIQRGKSEMDFSSPKRLRRIYLACLLASTVGCVAPAVPVPTVWQKLGIPQTGVRIRDGILNRQGNFPGLEKKPPLLKIADPANLEPGKPDMLKAAAMIKQEQDLKKQKLKALKYLAEINCGCYDKDGKVEAAFLEALEDCDPDIRTAAIEGLSKAAAECSKCRSGCEITCCTRKILEKLHDIAYGTKDGCFKEPVADIRQAAKALYCKCPPPAVEPIIPEELIAPDPAPVMEEAPLFEGRPRAEAVDAKEVSYNLSDSKYGSFESRPVKVGVAHHETQLNTAATAARAGSSPLRSLADAKTPVVERIANPEQLVASRVVTYRKSLGELLVHMPDTFEINPGWNAIVVDSMGTSSLATIADVSGRRILLSIERPDVVQISEGSQVRIGLIAN